MRGCIITETGWTYGEVNTLELPRAFELMSHWAKYPTPAMLLRAYFDVKPPVVDEKAFNEALAEPVIAEALGAPRQLSPEMRDLVNWAEECRKKVN